MRSRKKYTNFTVTSRDVQAFAMAHLEKTLPLKKPGHKCTASVVFGVLLFASCVVTSIWDACRRLRGAASDQAVRDALRRNLPKRVKDLERLLNESLYLMPRRALRKARRVAIDLHLDPYYGDPYKNKKELFRCQPKQGTSDYHAYATIAVVEKGCRYTLGFTWVKAKESMTHVVERLLEMVGKQGVKIRYLLLDRGFFSFDVIKMLEDKKLAWVMPVVIRGRAPKDPKKVTGLRALLRRLPGWYGHEMKKSQATISLSICVSLRHYKDKRGKPCKKKLLFAASGVEGTPREIRELYRKRFGIETTYRQIRRAWAKTTAQDPWLRLLLVGIALIVRNVWVWLLAEIVLVRNRGNAKLRQNEGLTFPQMLGWIFEIILRDLSRDLPEVIARKKLRFG